MLKWNRTKKNGHNRYESKASVGEDAEALSMALIEFWSKVLDELEAQPEETVWDIIVVQFVTQVGVLAGLPTGAMTGDLNTAPYCVELEVDVWSELYDSLPDPDEDELKFERAYDRLHKKQMSLLKKAIGDKLLKHRFAALKRRKSFAVFCVDEGDTPFRDRLEFLWGNRPAKRDFADAKELFEFIFNKAETHPDYSMKLKGKSLVAVHWSGHEFTNKYVELLENVPNVQELCVDIKDFILAVTRIDSSGVRRIKKLLPNAKVTVIRADDRDNDPWDNIRW